MDGHCKTCKHWQPTSWRNLPNHGECALIFSRDPSYHERPSLQDVPAFIADDEYDQNVTTRADFGCVLWEAKAT